MPRTRSLAWSELKIGLLSLLALALATLLIFLLSGTGGFFWQRYTLKTVFTNVAGLGGGAPVRVAGLAVGSVEAVRFVGDKVEVIFQVNKAHQERITDRSVASLGSVSLLGEAAVDITPSTSGTPIPEWGYVPAAPAAATIADVTTQASAGIQQITGLLQDIRGGRGSVGKLFTDEALYRDLTGLITSAEQVAQGMNSRRGTLGRLINDPAAAQALEASLQNLAAMTAKIRAGEGSIGQLLNNDALSRSLTTTTANVEAITGRMSRGEGTLGKLMTDQQVYERLNSVTSRLDTLIASLQTGQGTAGQLLQDRQLYENMNATAAELRRLVSDIRADPRKYLNVRVSLF